MFTNKYHLRKVAQVDTKPCSFCFKPTTSVLITSDQKDFFYTCDVHLKDSHFASPIYDEEYLEAKRKKELIDKEIKVLKLRWDEKNRYAGWDKLMSYTKWNKEENTKDPKEQEADEKGKLKELATEVTNYDVILSKQPRVYELNDDIFKIRVGKRKPKPVDTTNIKDTSMFPSVPQNKIN